jgi:GNAT superfamily N-acetyltransferase
MEVRSATVEELPNVLNVLDGALLEIEVTRLKEYLDDGDVLVAVEPDDSNRILGVLVLDDQEVTALAVRRRRRSQGIGTNLVDAARERRGELVAEFDERVRPFWESVGCTVDAIEESDRYRGRVEPPRVHQSDETE